MESDLNLKATELTLRLPGSSSCTGHESREILTTSVAKNNKRSLEAINSNSSSSPAPKAQIVGWPPVRSSYRKNNVERTKTKTTTSAELSHDHQSGGNYVKVSLDGAAYLRKIDLKVYNGYSDLLKALMTMFKLTIGEYSEREGYKGSEFAPAYEDKDGDLMLVGDVPWNMFMSSCKRLRVMRGSDARGLGCGAI